MISVGPARALRAGSSLVARCGLTPCRPRSLVARAAFRQNGHADADAASTSGSDATAAPAPGLAAAGAAALLLLQAAPAWAEAGASPFEGVTANRWVRLYAPGWPNIRRLLLLAVPASSRFCGHHRLYPPTPLTTGEAPAAAPVQRGLPTHTDPSIPTRLAPSLAACTSRSRCS
jgi:hypothetical protein